MLTTKDYVCPQCRKSFKASAHRKRVKFCSHKCQGEHSHHMALAKFWDRVDRTGGDDACWTWKGATARRGYGCLTLGMGRRQAHRIAFFLTRGHLPQKPFEVCHSCDNPPCCNPGHLFKGTRFDNMQDCVKKGRNYAPIGEKSPTAKLSAEKVLAIRSTPRTRHACRDLARLHGVKVAAIYAIWHRRTWKHL